MKRRWYKWFGFTAGLILCLEACMLMVEAPDGGYHPTLVDRLTDWFRGMRAGPTTLLRTRLIAEEDRALAQVLQAEQILTVAQTSGEPAGRDWPMFGGTLQRNMVNLAAKDLPLDWSVDEGKFKNIKWAADLGTKSYGGPIIADGKVFFGTNNGNPRNPALKGQKAVMMCFNEADGKFLWQAIHEIPDDRVFEQMKAFGLVSTPCVEGKRHYYCTPACEVVCADNATGKTIWKYDLMAKQKVVPYHCCNCSPLVVDDLVMVVTGNGSDDDNKVISPKAPSFIAIDKNTGAPAWQSDLPGDKIIEGQWSNPAVAVVGGQKQVIFPGGDCWVYSFDVKTGKLIWKCDCNPRRGAGGANAKQPFNPYFVSTPVVYEQKCYIGLGVYPGDHPAPPPFGYLLCLDVTGKGDISPKSFDSKDALNKGSGLVWAFGGPVIPTPKRGSRAYFNRTISTCAIVDGLCYVSDEPGFVYCLDAKTGKIYWQDDMTAHTWGSPFYADGKVYVGNEDGAVIMYQPGKQLKRLGTVEMGEGIHSTPVVANNVLYVSTHSKLYAIAEKK